MMMLVKKWLNQTYLLSDIYPLLWPFNYIVGGVNQ